MAKRDIVVIGASAGGIEALLELVPRLPADLDAVICIVVHIPAGATSLLPRLLTRRGRLTAVHPRDGEKVERGKIYVAPPGVHLLLEDSTVSLVRGPREHGVRPAVDPLFRSAALEYGPRVVGILLSGNLDDGTAGLEAIRNGGGTTIVQDPAEALYPGMSMSAIENGCADRALAVTQIAETLTELLERGRVEKAGEMKDEREEKQDEIEAAFWIALRALEERAALLRRLITRAEKGGNEIRVRRYTEEESVVAKRAKTLRDAILSGILADEQEAAIR